MITEKAIFDLLCMLDSGEQSLPFGRLVSTKLRKATFPRANLFDLQQRRFGSENIDKDDNLHGQNVFAQVCCANAHTLLNILCRSLSSSEARNVRMIRHSKTHARVVPEFSAIDCISFIVFVNMKMQVKAKKSKI